MFKRANKVTALLIAAASIMSVVPAMAAEKLSTNDGTVKQGFAYEDGQYGYFGYRTDSDETGIWYNKGGDDKDSAIEDLDEYEYHNSSKFGEKYAYALNDSNNDDEYIIDLSTGKVVEDETIEEKQSSAQSKLQSALKKAERFNGLLDENSKLEISDADFKQVLTGQFGEVWYKYTTSADVKYDNDLLDAEGITTSAAVVLTNEDGKYIDISVDANMRVYSTKKSRAVVVDKYDKDYNDDGLNVRLNKIQVLAQTKDDFYVLTEVLVTDLNDSNSKTTQNFIQKISKTRGSQDDGSYLPKDVTSYQLDSSAASIYDDDDAHDAYDAIMTGDDDYAVKDNLYAAKDDVLYVTQVKLDKAKVLTLKLGKVKVDGLDGGIADTIEDIDTNLVKQTDDADHDVTDDAKMFNKYDEDTDNFDLEDVSRDNEISAYDLVKELNTAVSIDTEGNTWVLDTGKVYKFDGSDFKEMYKVDRNSDSLDVYNEGNLIAYEKDGGAYTTVQEGKKVTVDQGNEIEPNVTTPALVGWNKDATTGAWNFYDVSGAKTANYWANDNGTWYYIKADGVMATGWQQVGTTWYYLNGNGSMATGWVNDNGTWYYLGGSGAMTTGWLSYGGSWYYLYNSGNMASNTTVDGYTLGASGAWVK